MNINVGIELGCAIRAHGEEQILLVLNEHYGGREFLPFHLQDLGGPVTYHLPPDATKEQIDAALSKLRGKFVTAIREFLKKAGAARAGGQQGFDDQSTLLRSVEAGGWCKILRSGWEALGV